MPSALADLIGPVGTSCRTCRFHAVNQHQERVCCNGELVQQDSVKLENGDSVKLTMQLRIPDETFVCSKWQPRTAKHK